MASFVPMVGIELSRTRAPMSTNVIYPIDKPRAACEKNLRERNRETLLGGFDVRFRVTVAEVPGRWHAFHRIHGVGVEAPGGAAQRVQSQSLQSLRVALGDGPSL